MKENKTEQQTEPEWCFSQSASDIALVPPENKKSIDVFYLVEICSGG